MCDSYFPLNDEFFDEVIQPLDERLPKAMAFLRRIGCVGLMIESVATSCITLVPLMSLGAEHEVLTCEKARTLGMTSDEENQFIRRLDKSEQLSFSEPWQWGPPRFHWQRTGESEVSGATAEAELSEVL